ncbi:MAG: YheC/YheD family endospore coat-associated protein [Desulfitobacteriaceae bacterium]
MDIQIELLSENRLTNICQVSWNIFDSLKLSEEVKYNLYFGQLRREVFIRPVDGAGNCIYLSPDIFNPAFAINELMVLQNVVLNIWKKGEDIHLGPVLGIFIKPKRLSVPKEGSTVQSHMHAGLAKRFLCYFFSIDRIDWENERIKGFAFIPGLDKWTDAWFPMPEVIYDRGARFAEEQKTTVRETRERFRNNPNVQFINSLDFLGKWETYRHLSKYNEIAKYLPMTVRYRSFNDLMLMLKKHSFIFLKAYYGSGGKQVLSIEKSHGKYKLVFYSSELQELKLNDVDEVRKHIEGFTEGRKFILQRGIRLLKYKGRFFDMRVLIIKDKEGQWRAISNYARIAKANLTITNYCAGGDCDFYKNIYPNLSSPLCKSSIPNYDDVANGAIKIAAVIDREFGTFGELGMDMAIDKYGKIWFIEANTKPDKDLVEGLDDYDDIHPQYMAVFEYAGYLCGLYNPVSG